MGSVSGETIVFLHNFKAEGLINVTFHPFLYCIAEKENNGPEAFIYL